VNPYVQNAFGCSGQSSDVTATSPEGINLDVIGYDLVGASPKPTPSGSDILVSLGNPLACSGSANEMNSVREFTSAGALVRAIPFNYNNGPYYPNTEYLRHIVVDQNGYIDAFNGTSSPYLTRYSPSAGTFTHTSFSGWDTVNNTTYGGIAAYQNFIYVTDTGNYGNPDGIVRFDMSNNSAARFALGTDFINLTIGLDGKLYALSDNYYIDVFDPLTMVFINRVILPFSVIGYRTNPVYALAVDQSGQLFLAGWNGTVYRLDKDANLTASNSTGFANLTDIRVDENGRLILGQEDGRVVLGDSSLSSFTSFLAVTDSNVSAWTISVAFARAIPGSTPPPTPIPTATPTAT